MLRIATIFSGLLLLLFSANLAAQHQSQRRGRVYIDRGACEGEGCGFGPWKPRDGTILYARPDVHSRHVAVVRPGPCVNALTGEVHVIPGELLVTKPHGEYKPGDVLGVYTSIGEDYYKIRFRGRWREEEDLLYSTPDTFDSKTCAAQPFCWGEFIQRPRSVAWAKVRDASGHLGWTYQPENFVSGTWLEKSDCEELYRKLRQPRGR